MKNSNRIDMKPLGLDKIPAGKLDNTKMEMKPVDNIPAPAGGNQSVQPLNNSKTLWGFGIALLIFIIQQVLVVFNVADPDNMLVNAGIEVVIAVAGFFGVYGIRDALRRLKN